VGAGDWSAFGEVLGMLMRHWFAYGGEVPMRFFTNIDYHQYFVISCLIFCLGFYGVVAKRNAISMLLAMELMLNAVNINLSAFNQYWGVKLTLAAFTSEKTVFTNMGQCFSVFAIIVRGGGRQGSPSSSRYRAETSCWTTRRDAMVSERAATAAYLALLLAAGCSA
jgi:NADH:ubiquinone oxidoreductase subunit K